jgi:hypothetical protein
MAIDTQGQDFSAGPTRELFALPAVRAVPKEVVNYDVTRDGLRFLTTRTADPEAEVTNIDLVLGWPEELRRLVPGK